MELTASTYLIMLLGLLFGGLFLGFPMAFTLGGSAVLAALIYSGPGMLSFAASQLYSGMLSIGLISLPLFVFIACLFERSGIAEEMFDYLDAPAVVLGSRNWITPAYELEEHFFPQ